MSEPGPYLGIRTTMGIARTLENGVGSFFVDEQDREWQLENVRPGRPGTVIVAYRLAPGDVANDLPDPLALIVFRFRVQG